MKKTSTRLADGRELIYYDARDDAVRDAVDQRPLDPPSTTSEIRRDPLLGDSVADRLAPPGPHLPPAGRRVPPVPLRGRTAQRDPGRVLRRRRLREPLPLPRRRLRPLRGRLLHLRPRRVLRRPDRGAGRGWSWTRGPTAPPSCPICPPCEQVFCFENRGAEIGVTLGHPHGQIYAYPFTTPRTALMLRSARRAQGAHRRREPLRRRARRASWPTAADRAGRAEHWVAFVPYAAHWPYEVHLYPTRRVPDLLGLDEDAARRVPPGLPGTLAGASTGSSARASLRRRTSRPGTRRRSARWRSSRVSSVTTSRCTSSFSPSAALPAS